MPDRPAPDRPITRRDVLRITAVAGASAALGTPLARALMRDAGLHRVSETRTQMGTIVTLTVVHPESAAASAMIAAAFTEMDRLEGILSRHRSGTPVAVLNTTGRLDRPPRELRRVLSEAGRVSARTGGAFDITVAPLLELYEVSFGARGRPPEDEEIARVREWVDFRGVDLSHDRVVLSDLRMSVTLDGIAKGFIVDATMDLLLRLGAERVMVNAGGDMSTRDLRGTDPWTVGIQDPEDSRRYVGFVRLEGECIATSGDYMGSFTNDRRHHHIIDPRTGRSPVESASVTVITTSAMAADAWSTALLVLGPEEGLGIVSHVSTGPDAMFVSKEGARVATSGFRGRAE